MCESRPKIAAQLFTLRDFTRDAAGLRETLEACHMLGYEGVQLSAVGAMDGEAPAVDAETARAMLEDNGLVCCATHRPWKRLRERVDEEIAFHQALGCDYAAVGSIEGDYGRDPEVYARFLEDAQPVIEALGKEGIWLGYHNHAHEFIRRSEGPGTGYDLLIDGDPRLELEIDTYWAQAAGVNPEALLRRCAGRIRVIHLKDMEVLPDGKATFAPVGEGNMDWQGILGASISGGTEWWVVEQDVCRRDPFDCLRSSLDALTEQEWSPR